MLWLRRFVVVVDAIVGLRNGCKILDLVGLANDLERAVK